jgi:hypothetical protein
MDILQRSLTQSYEKMLRESEIRTLYWEFLLEGNISENAETDVENREKAYELFEKIANDIKNNNIILNNKEDKIFHLSTEIVGLERISILQMSDDLFAVFLPKKSSIVLNNNLIKSPIDLYSFFIKNKIYIVHELIHLLDYIRSEKILTSMHPKSEYNYNAPNEYNAYFQMIASEYDDILKKIMNSSDSKLELFKNNFGSTASEFLKLFLDNIKNKYPELYNKMYQEDKWKRKWFKRIYLMYQHMRERLVKHIERKNIPMKEYFST